MEYLSSEAVQGPEPLPSTTSAHCAPFLPVLLLFTWQKLSHHKLPLNHSFLCPLPAPDCFTVVKGPGPSPPS
eukprot:7398726-Ditylum_brightwellii.AAC.1